jgi:hypothetical protein
MSVWFYVDDFITNWQDYNGYGVMQVVSWGTPGGTSPLMSQLMVGTKYKRLIFNGNYADINSEYNAIEVDTWYNAVFTYDGTTGYLYLDGDLIGSNNFNLATVNTPVRIGLRPSETNTYGGWNSPFNGTIDEVMISDQYMDSSQVQSLYDSYTGSIPVPDAGGPYSGIEGDVIILNASDSYDLDEDVLQFRWDLDNDGIWDTDYNYNCSYEHTWNDDFSGIVAVDVFDGTLNITDTASVIISNQNPSVEFSVLYPDLFVVTYENITFNGTFTDPGTLDTHNITWYFDDGNHSYGSLDLIKRFSVAGSYNITLTVTDDDGGVGTYTFNVIINSTVEAIDDLKKYIEDLNLDNGIDNSIDQKLENAQDSLISLQNGNRSDAINKLEALISSIEAQRGKKISEEEADELINYVERLISDLEG